jgi:hypothetical protein
MGGGTKVFTAQNGKFSQRRVRNHFLRELSKFAGKNSFLVLCGNQIGQESSARIFNELALPHRK